MADVKMPPVRVGEHEGAHKGILSVLLINYSK